MPNVASAHIPYPIEQALIALGNMLRHARLARGSTIDEMAQRLNVTRQTYSRIELGDPNVRIGTVLSALELFGLGDRAFALSPPDPVAEQITRLNLAQRGSAAKRRDQSNDINDLFVS
jgi:transcriptional regulator with XRE-family HTH domain